MFDRELELPVRGTSRRTTRRDFMEPGASLILLDETGPGCIKHWWLTYTPSSPGGTPDDVRDRAHDLLLKIYYDGESDPRVEVTLAQYFCILLNTDASAVRSAAVTVLPKNACNSYLPIPFRSARMELANLSSTKTCIWYMASWQQYASDEPLTPLRLQLDARSEEKADSAGSYLMTDMEGRGFIAGMTKGVRVLDDTDAWYHTGGDLWLLDGETAPNPMRGIGGEDVFGMSFGVWDDQAPWIGTPHLRTEPDQKASRPGYECVNYRFFGPDPVWFETSAVVRFGSKANRIETVIYAYVAPSPAPRILSPESWELAGPFECHTESDFRREEWPEHPRDSWPTSWSPGFGQYVSPDESATYEVPVHAEPEHGWCDFTRQYRGRQKTNHGTQPHEVSAYAIGTIDIERAGQYRLYIGFDDWLALWVNGEEVLFEKHDTGFREIKLVCDFAQGSNALRIKLSNSDNFQWRLWAFSVRIEG